MRQVEIKYTLPTIILFFLTAVFARPGMAYRSIEFFPVENRDVIREENLDERARFNDYEIKIYRDQEIGLNGVLQIFKDGELVFEEQYHKYSLGTSAGDLSLEHSPQIGEDITGDGEPDLTVSHWSGGAHCCFDVYVFSIGEEFRFVDKIEGEHGFYGFEDLDADGIPEFILYDWAFAYWKASFAGSPAPRVVLSFRDGQYRVNYDLMRREAVSDEQYFQTVEENKDFVEFLCRGEYDQAWIKGKDCVTAYFWGHMLELLYTGHPQKAWAFADRAWDAGPETKQAFLDDFKGQLAISDYSYALPVDLARYEPDVDDENEKKDLRFKVYYDRMIKSLEKHMDNEDKAPDVPGVDTLRDQRTIDGLLRGWSGQ